MKNPPMTVLWEGISLIPKKGNQTQKIPPITSVKDKSVSSAAGICFDPIEYKIKPKHTKVPCVANSAWFFPVDKKFKSLIKIMTPENIQQNNPATATVVNFGVSFLHLSVIEKTAKPIEESNPKTRPIIVFWPVLSIAIINIPTAAIDIETQTFTEIVSFRNIKPNKAVIKGMAARHNNVTAAEVLVIE